MLETTDKFKKQILWKSIFLKISFVFKKKKKNSLELVVDGKQIFTELHFWLNCPFKYSSI